MSGNGESHTKTQMVLDPAFNHRQLPELVSWTMVCRPRPTETHDSGPEQRERQPAAHICNMVCIGHAGISPGKQATEALKEPFTFKGECATIHIEDSLSVLQLLLALVLKQ